MPTKVIIFGNAGQLGRELVTEFQRRGDTVIGLDRAEIDIADPDSVERCFHQHRPDIVVNAAAYNMVDVAENEPLHAYQVNALAVRNIAVQCRRWDTRLTHYSTDYVFDGTAGRPYTEEDKPHPLGAYAVSKLAGELYAQAYLDEALIIRTSGVFGSGGRHTARGNFPELMLRLASQGRRIRVVQDHIASPTYAPALANRTVQLIARGEHGLFHIGGGRAVSWFDYAKLIFEQAGLKPDLEGTNEREYRSDARRPKFSALANARMDALGLEPMPKLEDAVRGYLEARDAELSVS